MPDGLGIRKPSGMYALRNNISMLYQGLYTSTVLGTINIMEFYTPLPTVVEIYLLTWNYINCTNNEKAGA